MNTGSLNKLPNNATKLSLNDRFTAISSSAAKTRSRSRSRNRIQEVRPRASARNALFLQQLERKHKMLAAMKLKRRSLRTAAGAAGQKRIGGGGNRGRPLLRNGGLPRSSTMRADIEAAARKLLNRAHSRVRLNGRMGPRRPSVGGAGRRIAKRRLLEPAGGRLRGRQPLIRGRSRAREQVPLRVQGRSRSRSRARLAEPVQVRGRSRSRTRLPLATNSPRKDIRRGRSQSRNRQNANFRENRNRLPVKDRLGFPAAANKRGDRNRRGGVASGRIEKRRQRTNGLGENLRRDKSRARSALRNSGNRSRSSIRRNSLNNNGNQGQQRGRQLQRNGSGNINKGRGQSRQRISGGGRPSNNQNVRRNQQNGNNRNNRPNGRVGGNKNRNNQQQRNGGSNQRSRSRNRPNNNNSRRKSGPQQNSDSRKKDISRDALDKELDQYMATTKSESNIYLN